MSSVVSPLKAVRNQLFGSHILSKWQQSGKPYPTPHIVKQRVISQYKNKYGLTTLVETGTYLGDMVDAQRNNFLQIISIELSEKLAFLAKRRFRNRPNIDIQQGDSAAVLKKITPTLVSSALFWLDGHYSGGLTAKGSVECPVFDELDSIFDYNKNHIILIDDARLYIGKDEYPSLDELTQYIAKRDSRYRISSEDDIIRIEIN